VAFDALVSGKGEESTDFLKTVNEKYQKDETDEFLKPLILNKEGLVGGCSFSVRQIFCFLLTLGSVWCFFFVRVPL